MSFMIDSDFSKSVLRSVTIDDASAICSIYNHYVLNSVITFEEEVVSVAEMVERIRETTSQLPWLVCENAGKVIGYAYASQWKSRCVYRRSVETTVYLEEGCVGQGFGRKLYDELIREILCLGYHALIGGIALPNPASIALHEKLGFEKVAHFKEVGWKFNRWIDVGYWEKILQISK